MNDRPAPGFRLRLFAAMAAHLTRATGRPDQALTFALCAALGSKSATALNWRGIALRARASDWYGIREVLIENEYGAVSPYLAGQSSPVVLDMGANIGAFSAFAFAAAPDAKIHAYEPSAASHALLAMTAEQNPGLDWIAHRAAVWSADGVMRFANAAASTGSRLSDSGEEQVPTVSLATAVARAGGKVDLAKIDVEGAEEEILAEGAEQLDHIATLVIEIHPGLCDERRVRAILASAYPVIRDIGGRTSSKPLLLATKR
jgi:FkbM family methyltransferase